MTGMLQIAHIAYYFLIYSRFTNIYHGLSGGEGMREVCKADHGAMH